MARRRGKKSFWSFAFSLSLSRHLKICTLERMDSSGATYLNGMGVPVIGAVNSLASSWGLNAQVAVYKAVREGTVSFQYW